MSDECRCWVIDLNFLKVAAGIFLNKAVSEDCQGRVVDRIADLCRVHAQRVVSYDAWVHGDLEGGSRCDVRVFLKLHYKLHDV